MVCYLDFFPLYWSMSVVLNYLALGDSYTIGEAVSRDLTFPFQLVTRLREKGITCNDPLIIARTGWTTQNLITAIKQNQELLPQYDLVTLLIGVNNQYQGIDIKIYPNHFRELLETAIKLTGGNKKRVIIVSIPDYAYTPFGKQSATITREIDEYNRIAEEIAKEESITYVNITDISRRGLEDKDLIAEDNLHPSGKMYSEWIQRIIIPVETLF